MSRGGNRLNITLPEEAAAKLSRLAERTRVREGTLASSLLAQAIDDVDAGADSIVELLDGIPDAWQRIEIGLEQARTGKTIPFGES
jgi:predicted transcriptional regulator